MRLLGRASASQVIAAYRHDFVVEKAGLAWPEAPAVPIGLLPLERILTLASAGRDLFITLEATWELYELDREDLWRVASMWGDPPWRMPLCELVARVKDGRQKLSDDSQAACDRLRDRIRGGTFQFGELVGCRASAAILARAPQLASPADDYLCLIDGHHRVVTVGMLGTIPETVRMFVGSLPIPLGMAVANGAH